MTRNVIELVRPHIEATWLPEPELRFADGRLDTDPKVGISLWGPLSAGTGRHPQLIRVGMIGRSPALANVRAFIEEDMMLGVDGDRASQPFPGLDSAFGSRLIVDDGLIETITTGELGQLGTSSARQRFESFLSLVSAKIRLLAERDSPPDVVFIVFDQELDKEFRVVNYHENKQALHRDLRRAIKAEAMAVRMPTQLIHESTTRRAPLGRRSLDHPAEIAWHLATGLYFKAGGLPWGATGLEDGTCYVGVGFYRPMGDRSSLVSSVVQAFDDRGDGLVLRGQSFHWDERHRGRSPHLPAEAAAQLLGATIDRYRAERRQTPRRVVVHKSSWFEPAERDGFVDALKGIAEFDLLALRRTSDWRLLRFGKYPPLRGTVLTAGEHNLLYTTGWIADLGYDHGHVPAPIEVADHYGDSDLRKLLREVLVLTKMNWNSAGYADADPITLRFSQQVGEILREVPPTRDPLPQYRYYM
jgi:hypothetical protein